MNIINFIIPGISLSGILMAIPGAIIAVTLHEYAKSLVAYKMGDTNVKAQRRLAPNPLKHMDILGSIFLVIFGYGWSSPVRLTPFSFKDRRKAMLLIFIIPFLVNIIVGVAFAIASNVAAEIWSANMDLTMYYVWQTLFIIAVYNITFALFSLIPVHPLNGINFLAAVKPIWAIKISQHEKYLQVALAFFIALGFARAVFAPLVFGMMFWTLTL